MGKEKNVDMLYELHPWITRGQSRTLQSISLYLHNTIQRGNVLLTGSELVNILLFDAQLSKCAIFRSQSILHRRWPTQEHLCTLCIS